MAAGNRWRIAGPLELLFLQPTPYCNLDCSYCYLPDRDNRARMGLSTLEMALRRISESQLFGETISVVWHAGEPLAVPSTWYLEAFEIVRRNLPVQVAVEHHLQTNG